MGAQLRRVGEKLSFTGFLAYCPSPISGLFKAWLRWVVHRDPAIFTDLAGAVGISSAGMFAKGHNGWRIYRPDYPLELLLEFNHAVIDGAPAARFTQKLVELIEYGSGLEAE